MSKTKSQLQADIAKFETLINKDTTSEGQKKVFRAIQAKAQAKLDAMDKPSEPKAEAKKQAPKKAAPKRKAVAKKEEPKKATPKKKTVAKKKTTKKKTAKKKTTAKKSTAKKSSNRGSFAALRSAIAKREGISYKAALPIAKKEYAEQKKSITKDKVKKSSSRLDAYKRKYKGRGLEPVDGRALDVQKDAKQQALPRGKRISKGTGANQYGKAKKGKVYYEYRSNRTDIRQPKKGQTLKPPRLAKGGYINKDLTYEGVVVSWNREDNAPKAYVSGIINIPKNSTPESIVKLAKKKDKNAWYVEVKRNEEYLFEVTVPYKDRGEKILVTPYKGYNALDGNFAQGGETFKRMYEGQRGVINSPKIFEMLSELESVIGEAGDAIDDNIRLLKPFYEDAFTNARRYGNAPELLQDLANKLIELSAVISMATSTYSKYAMQRFKRMGGFEGELLAKGGKTNDKVSKKIKVLKAEGYPHDQAVAIALSMRDSGKLAKGGMTYPKISIEQVTKLVKDKYGYLKSISKGEFEIVELSGQLHFYADDREKLAKDAKQKTNEYGVSPILEEISDFVDSYSSKELMPIMAKGGILKSEDHGAAYKLDGDTLMYAPLMDSGKYDDDDWAEVDFNRIDVDLANAIKKETESLYAQGGELFDADTEVQYAKGGMINFNPRDFSLAEIDQHLLDQDIFLQWLAKGDSTSSAFEREMLWNSNRSSTEWNKVKNMRLTMSDYGILEFSKGSENLYFNVVVYDNESGSEIPMNLQMYAKEYEGLDNLKKFANKFVKKLSKGGFIQDAVKDMKKKGTVGAFTAQARKRGLKPVEFAKEVLRSPDEFSETTRKRAQFVKNANPELFNFGGEIVRKYDVNIKSGVGTYAKGGNVKKKDDLVEILTRVKEEEGESDMYYDLQMKLVAYGDNPDVARKEFMSVLENYDVRPQYYLGEDNEDDYDVMGSFDEEGDLI